MNVREGAEVICARPNHFFRLPGRVGTEARGLRGASDTVSATSLVIGFALDFVFRGAGSASGSLFGMTFGSPGWQSSFKTG